MTSDFRIVQFLWNHGESVHVCLLSSTALAHASQGRNTRMQQWINYRVRITLNDGRMLVGTFMAFDRHMNVVLSDCEEFRRVKVSVAGKKDQTEEREAKRGLGLIMIRGETIVSFTAEAPPPVVARQAQQSKLAKGQAAGRGVAPMGQAPLGLAGPVRGVGGPAPAGLLPSRPM